MPAVEAEDELVEVVVEVFRLDAAVVRPEQPALRERGDPVYAWELIMGLAAALVDD